MDASRGRGGGGRGQGRGRGGEGGGIERGDAHYFRIVGGDVFLIEYANTQNEANHAHAVWRLFKGDFGRDLLAEHFADDHAGTLAEKR